MWKKILLFLLTLFHLCTAQAQSRKDPRTQSITRDQLQQLITKTPIDSRMHSRLIKRAYASGLIGFAYVQYNNLWHKQQKNAYANLWRGSTALSYWSYAGYPSAGIRLSPEQKMRLWEAGRSGLRDAVSLMPDFSLANASYGNFLFNQPEGEQEGIRLMRKAVALEPKNAGLWAALGDALSNPYRKSHNPEEAEKALLTATRLDPLYAAPHYTLIRFYVGQKRFKEAQRELKTFTSLVPPKDAVPTIKFFQPRINKGLKKP